MKRFYCTICKRVKRVRVLPSSVDTHMSPNPANREGMCDRHFAPRTSYAFTPVTVVAPSQPKQTVNKSAQRQQHKQASKMGVK